jgi:hypothetical protein
LAELALSRWMPFTFLISPATAPWLTLSSMAVESPIAVACSFASCQSNTTAPCRRTLC